MGPRRRRGRAPFARLAASLLLAACTLAAGAAAAGVVQPDYSIYLRKSDLLDKVGALVAAHPDSMKAEIRHAADGDYKADISVITYERGGVSPSHRTKARLLLDFGEHGREFISSEVGLRLLQVLADDSQLDALLGGSPRRSARLKAILEHCVLKVLPMENEAGRALVESGRLCERKNGRGVDTNRNWDIDWGKKEKDYDPAEEFPGRAPHSEPEVQVLLALARELQPHVWLNVHSGMYALFTPYDHKAAVPNTTDARAALRMLDRIRQLSCPQCVVGSGGHSVGYLAHGTGTDYMFEVLKVPMAFTWEIYGDSAASFEDCFRMFNPLGRESFDAVVTLWAKALLQLIELLPTHPAVWPIFKPLGLDRFEAVTEGLPAAAAAAAGGSNGQGQPGDAPPQQPAAAGEPAGAAAGAERSGGAGVGSGAEGSAAAAAAGSKPDSRAQPGSSEQQQPGSSEQQQQQQADGATLSIAPRPSLGEGPPGLALVRSSQAAPLLLGLAGLGLLLVLLVRSRGSGPGYARVSARLPVRRGV